MDINILREQLIYMSRRRDLEIAARILENRPDVKIVGIRSSDSEYTIYRKISGEIEEIINRSINEVENVPDPLPEPNQLSRHHLTHPIVDKCPICLDELQGDVIRTCCQHTGHQECFTKWFQMSRKCPVCRTSQESS